MFFGYGIVNNHAPILKATAMRVGAAISSLLTGLYAVYKGESNANDSLGTYNGTAQGGLTYSAGKSGNAFTFNGTNAYVSLPDDSLNFTSAFSHSFWVKSSDTTNYTIILGNIQGARSPYSFAHGYQFWLSAGKVQVDFRDGTTTLNPTLTSSGSVANGSWNHVAITFNPLNLVTGSKIYINGSLDISGVTPALGSANLYSSPMKACIGARNISGSAITNLSSGTSLDESYFWTKELTATEATDLYNSGTGKFYPTF